MENLDTYLCKDYNQFMGEVEKHDQLLSYYTFSSQNPKWCMTADIQWLNLACDVCHSPKLIHKRF